MFIVTILPNVSKGLPSITSQYSLKIRCLYKVSAGGDATRPSYSEVNCGGAGTGTDNTGTGAAIEGARTGTRIIDNNRFEREGRQDKDYDTKQDQ